MSGVDRLTELLPCPFCGGTRATCWNIMMGVQAMCKDCKSGTGIVRDAATAIAAWNRRASQAAPAPSAGCEWCVDGVQADGETPCPCTKAAPAPSDWLREAVDAAWNDAIEAAAEACTTVIKDYDVMTPCGNKYEPIKVQKAAKGMVSLARQDIRALRRAAPTEDRT